MYVMRERPVYQLERIPALCVAEGIKPLTGVLALETGNRIWHK